MKNLYLCIHVHSPKLGKVYVLCWFLVHNFVNRDEWVQEPAYWRDTALGELSLLSFWVFLLKMVALTETLATMTLLRKKKNGEVSLPELVLSNSLLFSSRPESSI